MTNSRPSHESDDDRDEKLIASIAPDVIKVLIGTRFFEKLDDELCPGNGTESAEKCAGNYVISEMVLRSLGFDGMALGDIFGVLRSRGGFCDCEILYNVSETNRLKANYWKAQAEKLHNPPNLDSPVKGHRP